MPGGRPKGSISKHKKALLELIQEAHPGYHPVKQLADFANDETLEKSLRAHCAKEVAKYVAPQLKAVEVSSQDGGIHLTWDTGIDRSRKPTE